MLKARLWYFLKISDNWETLKQRGYYRVNMLNGWEHISELYLTQNLDSFSTMFVWNTSGIREIICRIGEYFDFSIYMCCNIIATTGVRFSRTVFRGIIFRTTYSLIAFKWQALVLFWTDLFNRSSSPRYDWNFWPEIDF